MFNVFITYSKQDCAVAHQLAAFIECGMSEGILVDLAEIGESETLLQKVGEGLSAQAAIVLLSPGSAPTPWIREEWKPALLDEPREAEVPVAFLQCRECQAPDLLRRKPFFELGDDPLDSYRKLKRWLLENREARPNSPPVVLPRPVYSSGKEIELDALRCAIADSSGLALIEGPAATGKTSLALEFACRYEPEFDWVLWLNCAGRGEAGALGDLAALLGLRLERDARESAASIRRFLEARRFLLLVDDAGEAVARTLPSGRTSVILTTRDGERWRSTAAVSVHLSDRQPAPRPFEARELALMNGMCACAPSGFPLALAANAAGIELEEAPALAACLVQAGAAYDFGNGRYALPRALRDTISPDPMTCRRHAGAVARLLAKHAVSGDFEDYGNAQWAMEWCLGSAAAADRELGCDIAWRAATLARAGGRMPEAFEYLTRLFAASEQAEDRQRLRSCAQEMIWILGTWERTEEAERYSAFLRDSCDDQLWLNFTTA